jgi:hypothetical protein
MSVAKRGICNRTIRTRNVVGAYIDDYSTRLDPLALDKLGLADGRDDDIGLTNLKTEINKHYQQMIPRERKDSEYPDNFGHALGATVALSHSCITFPKHSGYRTAHNIAPPENYHTGSGDRYSSGFNESDAARWGAGCEKWLGGARRQMANVVRVKSNSNA